MSVLKDNKRNTWYFRVYVNDINGRINQKCRSGFKTKKEAQLEENKFLFNYKPNNKKQKFVDLYQEFIKYKKQNIKHQSYITLKNRIDNHILPYFENYYIENINQKEYMNWKEYILKKNYKHIYNSELHGAMVMILNYSIKFYGLEKNIASMVGNFSKKYDDTERTIWNYEEFNKFIACVDDNVYYALFRTLYFTGLRIGECLSLNWNDFEDSYLHINKSISKMKENGENVISSPKTKKSNRIIKLDSNGIKLLNDLKEFYKKYVGFDDSWFIFGGLIPLSRTTIGRKKDEYCKKAQVKRIRIHDFRHSHATLLLSNGLPITAISERLGHSETSMTLNIYSHAVPEDEKKITDLIENLDKKI